ncbi:hypothetical protein TNCV_1980861 [Trichonephila clavipes]|nr:hypothetical protein TNCV_1980861 [Trichonephila clavipes]
MDNISTSLETGVLSGSSTPYLRYFAMCSWFGELRSSETTTFWISKCGGPPCLIDERSGELIGQGRVSRGFPDMRAVLGWTV